MTAAPAITATARRRDTYWLLGLLHAGQYVPVSFVTVTLVAVLREHGASLGQIATLNTVGLLLAGKVLWAPLLDRYGSRRGHYRSWLLVLQPLVAVPVLALLPLHPVGDFGIVLALVVVMVQLLAVQDVAADALAVRSLDAVDRGTGSGFRFAGGYAGHILGAGAVLLVYGLWGWHAAIVTLAVLVVAPCAKLVRFREPPAAPGARSGFRAVLTVFRQPSVRRWALMWQPLCVIGSACGYALVTPMLVDAGWTAGRIAFVVGVAGSAAGAFGAIGAGAMVRRLGRRRGLALCCWLQGGALVALSPLAFGHGPVLPGVAALCLFGAAYAAGSVAINTLTMDLARPFSAASDFTVLNGVVHVVGLGGASVALAGASGVGYPPVLLAAASVAVVAGFLVSSSGKFPAGARRPRACAEPAAGGTTGTGHLRGSFRLPHRPRRSRSRGQTENARSTIAGAPTTMRRHRRMIPLTIAELARLFNVLGQATEVIQRALPGPASAAGIEPRLVDTTSGDASRSRL